MLEGNELAQCRTRGVQEDTAELKIELGDSSKVKLWKEKTLKKRQKWDNKCKSMLVARNHDDQVDLEGGRETPKQMWDALVRISERKSVAKRLHLNREMHGLSYTEGYREAIISINCQLLLSLKSEYEDVAKSKKQMIEKPMKELKNIPTSFFSTDMAKFPVNSGKAAR